jgi:hypothetical protein
VADVLSFIDSNKESDLVYVKTTEEQASRDRTGASSTVQSVIGNDSTQGRVSGDAEKDLFIGYSSPFLILSTKIGSIKTEIEVEAREVYKNCLEDKAFSKILILNQNEENRVITQLEKKQGNEKCFIKITSSATWNKNTNEYETGLMSSDITCMNKLNSSLIETKKIFTDVCKPALKEYYTNKKNEIADIEKQKAACEEKNKKPETTNKPGVALLPRLFNFILEFLKKVAKCVAIGFMAGLLSLGVKILVSIMVQILSSGAITVLKIVWYVGRSLYYLRKAWLIDDTKKFKNNDEKVKVMREKAETYGIAVGNIIKIALSTLGISLKKFRKESLIKRRVK